MAKMIAAFVGFLGLAAGSVGIAAESRYADVASPALVLQAPEDYCSVDASHAVDGKILEELQATFRDEGATILAMYADCDEVEAARSNGGGFSDLRHFAVYARYEAMLARYSGWAREEFVAELYERSSAVADNDQAYQAIQISRDDVAVYSRGAFKYTDGSGRWGASVVAVTIIHGQPINLILTDIERHRPDLDAMLSQQRSTIERFLAANE